MSPPAADDDYDVRTSWPALVLLVVSCSVALAQSLRDDPATAVAAVASLVAGALLGRLLRLEQLFRRSPAWMGAVAISALAVVLRRSGLAPSMAAAAGVFLLPLDWGAAVRGRVAVAAGFVFLILSTRDQALSLPAVAAWGLLAIAALVLLERDRRAVRDRPVAGPADRSRAAAPSWRDGAAVAVAAVAAVLVALVVLPPPEVAPSAGRTGRGGEGDVGYWGFEDGLDTAHRGQRGDEVVARVQARSAALWRGATYTHFDGRVWTYEPAPARPLAGRDWLTVPGDGLAEGGLVPTVEETQVFTFEQGGIDLVFGANRPRAVRVADGFAWRGAGDAVRLDTPLGRGGSYTVVSERAQVSEQVLRDADPRAPGATGHLGQLELARLADHLEVPASTSDRTIELAASVTAGAATAYDQIRALEAWLGANTTYTLDVPAAPEGVDTVDQYLFVDRAGFCEQIASALTVMARSLGIPARLAVGFVPDHQDTASGEWVVLSRGAHAWVEVWFPGVGWQGFDPTASVPLAPEGDSSVVGRAGEVWPTLAVFAAVVALGAALSWGLPRWQARRARRRRPWAERAVERLAAAGARAGRPRAPTETLVEYGDALEASALSGHGAAELGRALSGALFAGPAPPSPAPGATPVDLDPGRADHALVGLEAAARAQRRARWRRRLGRRR